MRKIIHIDMDAFFASVEQLDDTETLDKPVAAGGGCFFLRKQSRILLYNHTCPNSLIGTLINQDDTTGNIIGFISIEVERL